MKVAMFTDSYRPQINGLVSSIDVFREELKKFGINVTVFAPSSPDYKKREKFVYRFKSVPFTSYKEYRIGVPYKVLTDKRFRKMDFDVIHIQSPFSIGALGLGFSKHYKIPCVATFHTLFPDYIHYLVKSEKIRKIKGVNTIFQKITWKYLSWFYNQCDSIVAPSEDIRNRMKKNGIENKIDVIPTGISVKSQKPDYSVLKKFDIKKNDKIILHVGRITKEKNIKFIIDSLKNILNNDVKLLITSDGPYRKELQEYVNKNKLSNVFFTGYLSKEKLNGLYKSSDLFVMASKTETQGLVMIEAIFNNVPLVVLNAPVTGSFVKKYGVGIVSKKGNFTENVKIMLNNKKMRSKFKNNFKKAVDDFDISRCTENLINVYKSVIKNHDQ
jgi:glycosyltransferase involved in cell wall biosynthesis